MPLLQSLADANKTKARQRSSLLYKGFIKHTIHSANFRYTRPRQGFLPFLKPFLREHFFPFS